MAIEAIDDGGCAMKQAAGGEHGGIGVGVPLVAMRVDQAGNEEASASVDHLGALANGVIHIAHGRDALALDGDMGARLVDGPGVAVDDPTVLDDFVGGLVAHRDIN